jgi:hypothetical protein
MDGVLDGSYINRMDKVNSTTFETDNNTMYTFCCHMQ